MSRGEDFSVEHPDYVIRPARYAKNKVCVVPKKRDGGFKTDTAFLAEAVGGKWTHRDAGYVMSVPQARRFIEHYQKGTKTKLVFPTIYSSRVVLDE